MKKAIIYSGRYVVGFHESPDPEEWDAQGVQYDLVEEIPPIILNPLPSNTRLIRNGEGDYALEVDPDAISPVDAKIAELNAACNAAILAGFTSDALGSDNTYDFGYDDQINLGGMLNAITAGIVTESLVWKASGTPQLHTIDEFKLVFATGLSHKNSKIGRYWTLKAQVAAATTPGEIEAITW